MQSTITQFLTKAKKPEPKQPQNGQMSVKEKLAEL